MVLVDTSVWIEVFRRRKPLRLEDYVDFDEVVTCLPVRQEVLQGFDNEGAYLIAREAFDALPVVESPLGKEVVDQAVGLYRAARRGGLTIRSGADCLIAACALRHGLQLLHSDRDFDLLARASALEVRNIARR